jgi:hypothetical protein
VRDQIDKLRDGYFVGPSGQRDSADLPDGSLYQESDTGLTYRLADGAWAQVGGE